MYFYLEGMHLPSDMQMRIVCVGRKSIGIIKTLFLLFPRAASLFSILLLLLRDSSNFKIKIQAAAALAVPETINGNIIAVLLQLILFDFLTFHFLFCDHLLWVNFLQKIVTALYNE